MEYQDVGHYAQERARTRPIWSKILKEAESRHRAHREALQAQLRKSRALNGRTVSTVMLANQVAIMEALLEILEKDPA